MEIGYAIPGGGDGNPIRSDFGKGRNYTKFVKTSKLVFMAIMEQPFENIELQSLRDLREIQIAQRDLEAQASAVSKRYKRGIKILQKEAATLETFIDDGISPITDMSPWDTRSDQLSKLILDPQLQHIPEDTSV